MSQRRLGVGVLGAHAWAEKAHLPGYAAYQRARLVAICDVLPERAKAMAEMFGIEKIYTNHQDLLADPEARFDDLGPGFYESRINTNRRARNLATQLQAITGQKIVIRDGKAVIAESAA